MGGAAVGTVAAGAAATGGGRNSDAIYRGMAMYGVNGLNKG